MAMANEDPIPLTISPDDVIIPIMGTTGAGKSSFIQLCTRENVNIGHGLMSCTAECMMYSLRYRNHVIRLIDTPGFDDSTRSETDILAEIALWLNMAYVASPRLLLSGLIYLHPINEPKMQGSAKRNLNMFRLLCGESNLQSVVLATTMWEKVSPEEGEKRLEELVTTKMFWGEMVEQGSHVVRHENNTASAMRVLDHFIDQRKLIVLDIQRQMVDGRCTLEETSAGQEQLSGLQKDKKKAEQRLRRNEEEVADLLRQQNREQAAILQAEQERYKRLIEERKAGIAALKTDMEQLKREKRLQWQREEQEIADARRQHQTNMAQMRRDMAELTRQQEAARNETEAIKKQRMAQAEERQRLEAQRQQEHHRIQQSQQDQARADALAKQKQAEADYWARQNQQAAQAAQAAQQQAYQAQMHQQQLNAQRQRMEQEMYQMQQRQYSLQQAQAVKIQQQNSLGNGLSSMMGTALQQGPNMISGLSTAANVMGSAVPAMAAAAGACNVM